MRKIAIRQVKRKTWHTNVCQGAKLEFQTPNHNNYTVSKTEQLFQDKKNKRST